MTTQANIIQYLNIPLYRDEIALLCDQHLTTDNINIVANMLAMTEALKSKNYHDGVSKIEPENELYLAKQYAQNVFSYITNPKNHSVIYDQHNKNWIAIFSAAILGAEEIDLAQKQELDKSVSSPLKANIKKIAKNESAKIETDDYAARHSETLSIQYMHGNEELHLELTACELTGSNNKHHVVVHKNQVLQAKRLKEPHKESHKEPHNEALKSNPFIDVNFSAQDKETLQNINMIISSKVKNLTEQTNHASNALSNNLTNISARKHLNKFKSF